MRNYKIAWGAWLSENEFTCVLDYRHPTHENLNKLDIAGYGWRRDDMPEGSFYLYKINQGHILKLGIVKIDKSKVNMLG